MNFDVDISEEHIASIVSIGDQAKEEQLEAVSKFCFAT
jgi:hypothetical protein